MQLLTSFRQYLISRQKILLKRRKVQLKNRPISQKRLKQQQNNMNISYEMKKLNIQQQLDRKQSKNHHINQIVQELFYPEIRIASQQQIELRTRQLSNNTQSPQKQIQNIDELTLSLQKINLPFDLLAIHEQQWQYFTQKHYNILLNRISYYTRHRQQIKNRTLKNWQRLKQKIKNQSSSTSSKQIKCPFLFPQRQQIIKHQYWHNMIQQIINKINNININNINQINLYIPIIINIYRIFDYLPAEIYNLLLLRNTLAKFEDIQPQYISKLFNLLKYKNKTKYNPSIVIQKPQQPANLVYFIRKMVYQIFDHPERYNSNDFINIFIAMNIGYKKMNLLTQQLLIKSQSMIQRILNDLNFQNILTYMKVYTLFCAKPNIQLLQILKYDLYRKCNNETKYQSLLLVLIQIKKRKLILRNRVATGLKQNEIQLQCYDLFIKIIQTLSKNINKLNSNQIQQLIYICYNNDYNNLLILEIMSTQLIKNGKQLNLQILSKLFFKLTLLGHRSKILSKFIFQSYYQMFHHQIKLYKQKQILLIPNQHSIPGKAPNFKQIHLQQCLIMMLWSIIQQSGSNLDTSINLDQLLTLIPIKLQSMDPLVIQLTLYINQYLSKYSMFPSIQWQFIPNTFPLGRLNQFYKNIFSKNQIQILMWSQAQISGQFIANYNWKQQLFLIQKWSKINIYNLNDYIEYIINQEIRRFNQCYFNKLINLPTDLLIKRNQLARKMKENIQKQKNQKKGFFKSRKNQNIYNLIN